ncbi:MAG: hypothetical protein AAF581_06860 [Planctomycetota bacterium]
MIGWATRTTMLLLAVLAVGAPHLVWSQSANDDCFDALVVTAGSYVGDTSGNNPDGSANCSVATGGSVWYEITVPENTLQVSTCGSAIGTDVSVHTSCPGTTTNQIACGTFGCGASAVVTTPVVPGTTYYVRVAADSADGAIVVAIDSYNTSFSSGPDVVYSDCTAVSKFGPVGGIHAYSLGSHTCNLGDQELQWGTSGPLLAMNAYRLESGRLEQIGMSFVKNATLALAGSGCGLPCNGFYFGLGPGCQDVYGSGFNGSHSVLGPRSDVNPFTGSYPGPSGPTGTLDRRLQIATADLTANGPYFVEGVYVAADDAAAGNALNNASYKNVTVSGSFDLNVSGAMSTGDPAIYAWRDHGLGVGMPDPAVAIEIVDVPSEGRFFVGHKATDLGAGQWRYDYAIFNLNSHRSADLFSVPVPPGISIAAIGFHDVDYHSGEPYDTTDWIDTTGGGAVTWASPQTFADNPDTNALRWGTMYNFWFESSSPPVTGSAVLGLFRPGTPSSLTVPVVVPAGIVAADFVRADCDASGSTDLVDATAFLAYLFNGGATPPCLDACDANNDGSIDISDPIAILGAVFLGMLPPPPYPSCGPDSSVDALSCLAFAPCP